MLLNTFSIFAIGKIIPKAIKPWLLKILVEAIKIEYLWHSRNARVNPAPIFILGNQKSGTSVVAALFGEMTGLSVTIDLMMEYFSNRQSYPIVANGKINFSKLIKRNKIDFSRDVIKEANLTPFYRELNKEFPQSHYIFVLRDPRDNIRSILNRVGISGDKSFLTNRDVKTIPRGWDIVLNNKWLEIENYNYIESLAMRWNKMVDVYSFNRSNMHLIRYEDFIKDKVKAIYNLVKILNLDPINDISDKIDIQYQPKGNSNVDWLMFYGEDNLKAIDNICGDRMKIYGYKKYFFKGLD
jgi:hypothetical protein